MANNIEEFCVEIEDTTLEERAWWAEIAAKIVEWFHGDTPVSKFVYPAGFTKETMLEYLPCDITVQGSSVYLADEGGACDLSVTADLIQRFLIKFRPDNFATIEAAFYCTKHRPGEFGGAACFITADEIRWQSTGKWVYDQEAAWRAERPVTCDNCNAGSESGWGDTPLCVACQLKADPSLVCDVHLRTHEGECPLEHDLK